MSTSKANILSGDIPTAAVDAAVAVAGRQMFADVEQVELALGDDRRGRTELTAAIETVRRGPGRRPNSLNKRTGDWRDYLTSHYRHPLVTLAMIQAEAPDKLAVELGCKPVEALAVIKSAAAELAPYLEGKMPVQLQVSGSGHMTMVMADAATLQAYADQAGKGGEGSPIGGPLLGFRTVQNQPVSGSRSEVSE